LCLHCFFCLHNSISAILTLRKVCKAQRIASSTCGRLNREATAQAKRVLYKQLYASVTPCMHA